ncbi:MAG TPA: YbhB/YbcL family Raf kinase inhibitor-like protein, partial [Candidatus Binatus sp.]|nr:YbhB/YbcL family Raf kinase inhibitor-like protein [Candidatus Binatus sp.]
MIKTVLNLYPPIVVFFIVLSYAGAAQAQLNITSSSFGSGDAIANDYACSGADRSPALAWSNAPQATKTFALVVQDPDAPGGTFIHWVAYNIPARTASLPAGVPQTEEIA